MYPSVSVLARDDRVSGLDQQLHALVDAVLSSVGDQHVARHFSGGAVRLRLELAQLRQQGWETGTDNDNLKKTASRIILENPLE